MVSNARTSAKGFWYAARVRWYKLVTDARLVGKSILVGSLSAIAHRQAGWKVQLKTFWRQIPGCSTQIFPRIPPSIIGISVRDLGARESIPA
jgi:hypothetical protein